MKIALITLFALIAFAANSLLNRAAFVEAEMGAAGFTVVRMISGAVMLALLVSLRGQRRALAAAGSWASAAALMLYAAAFSYAYLSLDAGLGALVLFGGVQITMFGGTLIAGGRPSLWRWAGSGLGLGGLALLFLPGADVGEAGPLGIGLMLLAALGWGIYSLRGASAVDPLLVTAGNFWRSVPVAVLIFVAFGLGEDLSGFGVLLAVLSGALASGCGYAIWYAVLPKLDATLAAVAQLCVPIIAMAGGIVLLGEALTLTFVLASALIIGGILVAILGPKAAI